jgi:hypothetical protein
MEEDAVRDKDAGVCVAEWVDMAQGKPFAC